MRSGVGKHQPPPLVELIAIVAKAGKIQHIAGHRGGFVAQILHQVDGSLDNIAQLPRAAIAALEHGRGALQVIAGKHVSWRHGAGSSWNRINVKRPQVTRARRCALMPSANLPKWMALVSNAAEMVIVPGVPCPCRFAPARRCGGLCKTIGSRPTASAG